MAGNQYPRTQPYTSIRLRPVKLISSLPFRNSLTCCPVSVSLCYMCMRTWLQNFRFAHPRLMITSYWKPVALPDHPVLDNSQHTSGGGWVYTARCGKQKRKFQNNGHFQLQGSAVRLSIQDQSAPHREIR